MRFIAKIVFIAVLSYLVELFLPWWSVVLSAFLVNVVLPTKGFNAFLSGFLGVGLLWLIVAWAIDHDTNSLLTTKVAQLFQLNKAGLIIALTGLIGGITGGFAALTGSLLRNINRKEPVKPGYYT